MKLALVVPGGVDRTGEFRVIPVLLALIERLARVHEVHVFALRQEPAADRWGLSGATVHNIGDGWSRIRAIAAIREEHRRAAFDLVHAIFSGSCGLVAVAAARLLGLPSLVHIAGGELVAMEEIGYGGRRGWMARMREAVVLRAADIVTGASRPIVESLGNLGIKGRRVPLGVDLRSWPPLCPRERHHGTAKLIHVASLNRVKDQATLLRALAVLARQDVAFSMDIVGVDTLHGEVHQLVRQLDLERHVHLLGFKTQRELRPLMEAADLLVMSSCHEAGPLVLLEAAAVGVPTVGTEVGHIAEWSPMAALAVPVGDWSALAGAIARVLADEPLRLRMALAAQRKAMLEDADYTARSFETIYLQLLTSDLGD